MTIFFTQKYAQDGIDDSCYHAILKSYSKLYEIAIVQNLTYFSDLFVNTLSEALGFEIRSVLLYRINDDAGMIVLLTLLVPTSRLVSAAILSSFSLPFPKKMDVGGCFVEDLKLDFT